MLLKFSSNVVKIRSYVPCIFSKLCVVVLKNPLVNDDDNFIETDKLPSLVIETDGHYFPFYEQLFDVTPFL